MKKSELNPNIRISESNVKLNHIKNQEVMFLMFSLPAIKSCPFSTKNAKVLALEIVAYLQCQITETVMKEILMKQKKTTLLTT